VVIADLATLRLLEVNAAAASMLGESPQALQGRAVLELFEPPSRAAVQSLVAAVEVKARASEAVVTLLGNRGRDVTVAASVFRQSGAAVLLLRFSSSATALQSARLRSERMLAVLDAMPDGFVVTGEDRHILFANAAFCRLVQRGNESEVIGEPLDRWLGRSGVDVDTMFANLREHGTIRNFPTLVRGDANSQETFVTAAAALDGRVPCVGFAIRTASSRAAAEPIAGLIPRSVDQMRELVGRVSLKEIVRESADLIERLCIEAALDVSGNNRASAAQLLGLSRQGLYSKLRRHGLAEFGPA
jgi:transcriptional regulator PpsR